MKLWHDLQTTWANATMAGTSSTLVRCVHICSAKGYVRFTPNSDRESRGALQVPTWLTAEDYAGHSLPTVVSTTLDLFWGSAPYGSGGQGLLVAIYRLLKEKGYPPEQATVLTQAYELVLASLELSDRTDPITELIAKKIDEVFAGGEHDILKIHDIAIKELGATIRERG